MKLIRLTSTDANAHFNSIFDEDIIIEPKSQIALNSLSMERVLGDITIDGSNDKITYTVNGIANEKDVYLAHDSYNNATIDIFEQDMQTKLNDSLQLADKQIGHQFKVDKTTSGKFQINCLQADTFSHGDDWQANAKKNGGAESIQWLNAGQRLLKENGASNGNNNNYISTLHDPLCSGAGVFRARCRQQVDVTAANGNDGFIVGLSTENLSAKYDAGTAISYTDMTHAIYYPSNLQGGTGATEFFYTINGGTPVVTGTNVEYIGNDSANNNVIDMSIAEGRLKGTVYSNSGGATGVDLIDVAVDRNVNYYPFIIIRGTGGAVGTVLDFIRVSLDPYEKPPTTYNEEIDDYGEPRPPKPTRANRNGYLSFESRDLADLLGYALATQPTVLSRHHTWTANYVFELHNLTDAFLVQMRSMELESYDDFNADGHGGGAQNLLAIVPYTSSDSVVYEANNLIWIDMKNASPISLRNFYARIVQSDYSNIVVRGLTTMTILIKNKDE